MKPLENPIHFILHDSEGATTANVPIELRRHGFIEVQRTVQMQELANVPVAKRSVNIDDNTRMEVATYKDIYKVDIFISKPFVEEDEEDAIDSERIPDGTKALFRVYSNKILVYDQGTWSVVDSWTEEDTGKTITMGAAYQPAIIPNEEQGKIFVGKGKTVTSGMWGQSFFSPRFIDSVPGGIGQELIPNESPPNDSQLVQETPVTNNACLQNTGFWLDGKAFPIVDNQTKSFPGGYDDVFASNLLWDEGQQIGWFFIAKQIGQTNWDLEILQGGIPFLQDKIYTGPTHIEIWKLPCYGEGRERLKDEEKDWTLADTLYLFTNGDFKGLFDESTYWANQNILESPGLRGHMPIIWGNFFPDGSFECPVSLIVDANQNTFTPESAHLQDGDFYSSAGSNLNGYVSESLPDFVGSVLIAKRLRINNVLSATSFIDQAELKSISPLLAPAATFENTPNKGRKFSNHVNGKGCLVKGLVLGNWYYEYRISTEAYPEAPTDKYYQRDLENQFEIEHWLQLWKTYYPPPIEADLKTFEPQFVEQYLLGTGNDGHVIQRQFLFVHPLLPKLVAFDQCEERYTYKPSSSIKVPLGATYTTNHFGEIIDTTYAYDGYANFSSNHSAAHWYIRVPTIGINENLRYIAANVSVIGFDYPYGSEQFAPSSGIYWSLNRGPWGEWGRQNWSNYFIGTFEARAWAAVHSEYGIPEALLDELDGVPPYIICMRRLIHLEREHPIFSFTGAGTQRYSFESRPAVVQRVQLDREIEDIDNPVWGPAYKFPFQYTKWSTYTEPLRIIEGVEPGLFAGSLDPESPDLKYPLDKETYRWTYRFYSNCLTERELQELTFDEETIELIDKGETGLNQIPIYLGIL